MNKAMQCYLTELIGTFALTFIGAGTIVIDAYMSKVGMHGGPGLVGIAIAHGVVLSIAVSAAMNVSGGHINPAVTITMLATGRIKPPMAAGYIVSQLIGASLAGFLLSAIFLNLGGPGREAIEACKLGTPNLSINISPGMGVVVEIALTFLLLFAIFGTAVDPRAPKIGGFGVGLMVTVDILMGGPLTGAAMNPARTFGTLIGGAGYTSELWSQHWVYWAGPVIGGLLAGLLYDAAIMDKQSK